MADIQEAQDILKALGMPSAQYNRMAGMTLIALCGLARDATWSEAERRRCTITKGIMDFIKEHYGTEYAPNTRETFRRQVLHQFVQGGVAEHNPFEPNLPTNSPKTHYAVTEAALNAVLHYGSEDWSLAVEQFQSEQSSLVERFAVNRELVMIPVTMPDGQVFQLSPGKHNEVQRAVVEDFAPRFAPGARLLYLGDSTKKDLFVDRAAFIDLRILITDHGKLPDVVLYDEERKWLFLIEAVTSHGPVSPSRIIDFENMLSMCPAYAIYVSAFPDFSEFRRHMSNIAWETEVWLCDAPDHMIHYDGDMFLGPRG